MAKSKIKLASIIDWWKKFAINVDIETSEVPAATDSPTRSEARNDFFTNPYGSDEPVQAVRYYNNIVNVEEKSKLDKLALYRQMASYSEISTALDEVTDEAINYDDNDNTIYLKIKDIKLKNNKNKVLNLQNEFNKLFFDRIEIDEKIEKWFREYLTTGVDYIEKVVDTKKGKDGVQRIKQLAPEITYVDWDNNDRPKGFFQVDKGGKRIIPLEREQVAYVDSGVYQWKSTGQTYGPNKDKKAKIPISYLENAIRTYRQLRELEDSLVIYRLVRSPERRVFNVDVGKLPPNKAEGFVKNMMNKYRQRNIYDTETGEITKRSDAQSMVEDFWFPRSSDGKGTTVDTLAGGANLGEIDDIVYFQKKLYKAMRIPIGRLDIDDKSVFNGGRTGEVTHEEIKFNKFVKRMAMRFSKILEDIFETHLKLIGMWDQLKLNKHGFAIQMNKSMMFEESKINEIFTIRTEQFNTMMQYAEPDENGEVTFEKEWLMREYLKLTDEQIAENESFKEKKKKEREDKEKEGGDDFGSTDNGEPVDKDDGFRPNQQEPEPDDKGQKPPERDKTNDKLSNPFA